MSDISRAIWSAISHRDFLHIDIDWRKEKGDLKIFGWQGSKMLLANQIAKFLKQLYVKKDEVSQPVLYGDRDSGKVNHEG